MKDQNILKATVEITVDKDGNKEPALLLLIGQTDNEIQEGFLNGSLPDTQFEIMLMEDELEEYLQKIKNKKRTI